MDHGKNKQDTMGQQAFVPPDFDTPEAGTSGVSGQMNTNTDNNSRGNDHSHGILSFGYYAWYFDVDTRQVWERCLFALNPFNKRMFLDSDDEYSSAESGTSGTISGGSRPDLYGPFWICTTVILVLFFSSTLVGLLFSSWQGVKYEYKFDLLTGAAGLMYTYTFVVPLVLWVVFRYLNVSPSTTLLQLVSLYGYSNIVWIPVAILSVSPLLGVPKLSNIIRWIFIGLGFIFSGSFIAKNIYRKLSTQQGGDKRSATGIMVAVLIAHVALSFAVKLLFFGGVKVKDQKD